MLFCLIVVSCAPNSSNIRATDNQMGMDNHSVNYSSGDMLKIENCTKEVNTEYDLIEQAFDCYEEFDQKTINDITSNYSISIFINTLQDDNYEYRAGAARILGLLKYSKSVPDLLYMAINDPNPYCKVSATLALYQIDEEPAKNDAFSNLIKDFTNPETESVYRGIIAALMGDIGDQNATPYLLTALKDPKTDPFVLDFVIFALGKIKGENIPAALNEFILRHDIEPYIRKDAIMALGSIGDDDSISFLSDILNSKDYNYSIRADAASALGYESNHSQKAISALINATKDENKGVRFFAVCALGKIPDERATKGLINALNDDCDRVRVTAVNFLGLTGDESSIPALTRLSKDDAIIYGQPIKEHVQKAIEQIKEKAIKDKSK